MNGLSCGEESMTICSAVLIQYQRVTDRQTDVQPIAKTCFSIADARKKRRVLRDSRLILGLMAYWPSRLKALAVNGPAIQPTWVVLGLTRAARLKRATKAMSSLAMDLAVYAEIFYFSSRSKLALTYVSKCSNLFVIS